jgi:hypothetical protein
MIATASPAKRLAVFTGVSLGLHLVLMSAIRPFRPLTLPDAPDTILQWVELPAPLKDTGRHSAAPLPVRPGTPRQPHTRASSQPPQSPPELEPAHAEATLPAAAPSSPPKLDTSTLLDATHAVAREMVRVEKNPTDSPPQDRPILPKLAKALQREAAGERTLGNGLTRIVTSRGKILCMQAPPDFARGGPVEMQSVQVNCPP